MPARPNCDRQIKNPFLGFPGATAHIKEEMFPLGPGLASDRSARIQEVDDSRPATGNGRDETPSFWNEHSTMSPMQEMARVRLMAEYCQMQKQMTSEAQQMAFDRSLPAKEECSSEAKQGWNQGNFYGRNSNVLQEIASHQHQGQERAETFIPSYHHDVQIKAEDERNMFSPREFVETEYSGSRASSADLQGVSCGARSPGKLPRDDSGPTPSKVIKPEVTEELLDFPMHEQQQQQQQHTESSRYWAQPPSPPRPRSPSCSTPSPIDVSSLAYETTSSTRSPAFSSASDSRQDELLSIDYAKKFDEILREDFKDVDSPESRGVDVKSEVAEVPAEGTLDLTRRSNIQKSPQISKIFAFPDAILEMASVDEREESDTSGNEDEGFEDGGSRGDHRSTPDDSTDKPVNFTVSKPESERSLMITELLNNFLTSESLRGKDPSFIFTTEEFSFLNMIRRMRSMVVGRIDNAYYDEAYRDELTSILMSRGQIKPSFRFLAKLNRSVKETSQSLMQSIFDLFDLSEDAKAVLMTENSAVSSLLGAAVYIHGNDAKTFVEQARVSGTPTPYVKYLEDNGLADVVPRLEDNYLRPSPWAEKEEYEIEFDDVLKKVR